MSAEGILRNLAINFLRHLPGAANRLHTEASISFIKDVVCYNQGRLADYYFLTNKKHKDLKGKLLEIQNAQTSPSNGQLSELSELYEDLNSYISMGFREVCSKNFQSLIRFYSYRARNGPPPRICLKAVRDQNVVTLARNQYSSALEEELPASSNSAFMEIKDTSSFYFCSDIPKAIQRNKYKNPRIHEDVVKRFNKKPGPWRSWTIRRGMGEDEKWIQCWKRIQSPAGETMPDVTTCYKSTLVIPMSLIANDSSLSNEFREHFHIKYGSSKVNIAFLCFDHVNINFFNRKEDVNVGYIFSDLLSLYLIQSLNCTDYSKIFNESTHILRLNGLI